MPSTLYCKLMNCSKGSCIEYLLAFLLTILMKCTMTSKVPYKIICNRFNLLLLIQTVQYTVDNFRKFAVVFYISVVPLPKGCKRLDLVLKRAM